MRLPPYPRPRLSSRATPAWRRCRTRGAQRMRRRSAASTRTWPSASPRRGPVFAAGVGSGRCGRPQRARALAAPADHMIRLTVRCVWRVARGVQPRWPTPTKRASVSWTNGSGRCSLGCSLFIVRGLVCGAHGVRRRSLKFTLAPTVCGVGVHMCVCVCLRVCVMVVASFNTKADRQGAEVRRPGTHGQVLQRLPHRQQGP